MIIKINELKAKSAAKGKRVTLANIVSATGINRRTLDNLIAGKQTEIRADYLDALAAFFDVAPNELIEFGPVELPLKLNIRPDRRGVTVGSRTKEGESRASDK